MLVPRVRETDVSGVTTTDSPTVAAATATASTATVRRVRPTYRSGVTVRVDGGGVPTPETPGADTPA